MKKILILLLLFIPALLSAAGMSLSSSVQADNVRLSWSEVAGATYYDIYNGQSFIVRLDSSAREYQVPELMQDTSYTFIIGARDSADNTLASASVRCKTGNYNGVYVWTNPTDDDNHGKMKELRVRAELTESDKFGQYMAIYTQTSAGEAPFFPIFPLEADSWPWVETKSGSITALVYNETAGRFNTSIISPSRFRQDSVRIDHDYVEISIRTRALGVEVVTITSFAFGVDEKGLYLDYCTDGNALVRSSIFKNPEGGDNPFLYRLRKVD